MSTKQFLSTKHFQPKQRHYSLFFSLFALAVLKQSLVLLQILSTSLFSSLLFCFSVLVAFRERTGFDNGEPCHCKPRTRLGLVVVSALSLSTPFLPILPTSVGTGSSNDPCCCAELFRNTGQLVMNAIVSDELSNPTSFYPDSTHWLLLL